MTESAFPLQSAVLGQKHPQADKVAGFLQWERFCVLVVPAATTSQMKMIEKSSGKLSFCDGPKSRRWQGMNGKRGLSGYNTRLWPTQA